MQLSSEYWNTRYIENDFGWDTGDITTPLKTYFDQLKDKSVKILIPGAGNSYEAEYLFNKGFKNVFVLDFAEAPLKNIKERCKDFPSEQLIQNDFFKHVGQNDLIIEQTFFCAIDPKLRADYAKHMHSLLKPKGKLVGVLFDTVFEKDGPPFSGNKEEYVKYFSPYFELNTLESCYNSIKPREGRELFIKFVKK
jgi:SAM-dependent methyltransferase